MKKLTRLQAETLLSLVGPDRFSTGESNLGLHMKDASAHTGTRPDAVIWPISTGDTAKILAFTYDEGIPVTPWGAGTSLEGNPVPTAGGLVLDFTRMDRILSIRDKDLQVDLQPGVLRKTLNREVGKYGLFFPPDPGADATIGGMIANNASGVQTVKYGATKDYVLRLVIVTPRGEVIHTGSRARKSSSGYDLTRLFVGSEGTLGVVTEATLRLAGIPEHHLAVTVTFKSLVDASNAVALLIASGLEPAALELLTPGLIRLMNREKSLGIAEMPSLFCELTGVNRAALDELVQITQEICYSCGAGDFNFATEEKKRGLLWRARHEAWETIHRAHPGNETLIVDAAVPISRYPELVDFAEKRIAAHKVVGYIFGHAGDGNLHAVLVGRPDDDEKWDAIQKTNREIVAYAIELGGTCTGEHGIGIGKRRFMELEHGRSLQLMREIKKILDPKGLMNPGKIFP